MLTVVPGTPTDGVTPAFDKFTDTLGNSLTRLQNLKAIVPIYFENIMNTAKTSPKAMPTVIAHRSPVLR